MEAKDGQHRAEHGDEAEEDDGGGHAVADQLSLPRGVVRHEVVRDWTAARLPLRRRAVIGSRGSRDASKPMGKEEAIYSCF